MLAFCKYTPFFLFRKNFLLNIFTPTAYEILIFPRRNHSEGMVRDILFFDFCIKYHSGNKNSAILSGVITLKAVSG